MALILDHFYSAALTECNSLTAIVPVENNEKSSYPVLWLLPPAGCDHTAWQRHTAVEDLADELGIIIVMPDLKLSYGLDMIHGFAYFQMLTKELPEHDEMYELHRLLGALLSKELTINEKLTIIGDEYNIPVEENFRRDVNIMCNLSQGIREDGIAEGEARIILNMHKNGLTAEQIATYTGTSVDDVIAIIETDKKAVLV